MQNRNIEFVNLGTVEYQKAYEIQLQYFNKNIEAKLNKQPTTNTVLFVEHPHVYTLGKSGNYANLIIPQAFLEKINATFVHTDRGGDITYHGYGQIVIYPIFDLDNFGILIKKYVHSVEEVIIRTLKEFNISATRIDGAAGVWLIDNKRPKPEKICALGIRVSRGITMHGLAFNINTDLNYFNYINPCGFTDKGVTSLEKELGHKVPLEKVMKLLEKYFVEVFQSL